MSRELDRIELHIYIYIYISSVVQKRVSTAGRETNWLGSISHVTSSSISVCSTHSINSRNVFAAAGMWKVPPDTLFNDLRTVAGNGRKDFRVLALLFFFFHCWSLSMFF